MGRGGKGRAGEREGEGGIVRGDMGREGERERGKEKRHMSNLEKPLKTTEERCGLYLVDSL